AGMRFVYSQMTEDGGELTLGEIAGIHEELLASLLEKWKLRRAEEIARKRAAGQAAPIDSLTTEAMVAQAERHIAEVLAASMELHEQRNRAGSVKERHVVIEQEIVSLVETHPGIRSEQLMDMLGVSKSGLYRFLGKLRACGAIAQERKGGGWRKSILGKQVRPVFPKWT
ncbi:MAG: hypothetical protein IJG84_02885, partial [Kiritimatiellae bacterium]|nr:hypothetical protein [Kiritimatiellia bacterium]